MEGQNLYINKGFSKEKTDVKKEKWKSVNALRNRGNYSILVFNKIILIRNLKKMITTFICYRFGITAYLRKHESITGLRYFCRRELWKAGFQTFWFSESNDPDINSLNNKSEAIDSQYFNIDEFNISSQKLLEKVFLSYVF